MKVLICDEIHASALKLLESFELVFAKPWEVSGEDFDAVVLRTFTRFQSEEFSRFSKLKFIVSCSVGVDNIDLEACKLNGVKLFHVPGTNANSVAEHALLLLLLCHRNPFNSGKKFSNELRGKTVGFIGFGAVGKSFARKLSGFDCRILAYDTIEISSEVLTSLGAAQVSFDRVLTESDVLTVHVPLLEQTRSIIDESVFSKVKNGVIFINTSRAEVVNEIDLGNAVKKGIVSKLGLDVYSEGFFERFKDDERFVFTPHVGALGEESFARMCVEPVSLFLKSWNR